MFQDRQTAWTRLDHSVSGARDSIYAAYAYCFPSRNKGGWAYLSRTVPSSGDSWIFAPSLDYFLSAFTQLFLSNLRICLLTSRDFTWRILAPSASLRHLNVQYPSGFLLPPMHHPAASRIAQNCSPFLISPSSESCDLRVPLTRRKFAKIFNSLMLNRCLSVQI